MSVEWFAMKCGCSLLHFGKEILKFLKVYLKHLQYIYRNFHKKIIINEKKVDNFVCLRNRICKIEGKYKNGAYLILQKFCKTLAARRSDMTFTLT